jgi:hypothetical protein
MAGQRRQLLVPILVALAAGMAVGLSPPAARAQQGVTASQPASAVMSRGVSDGWHSQGGVVGPWWSGSGTGAAPPAGGGFWFGWPGLGFGGSQGSSRGLNAAASSVTTTSGGGGMMSSSRLVPFVTGVVPVVGNGFPHVPVTAGPMPPWSPAPGLLPLPQAGRAGGQGLGTGMGPGGGLSARPSTPGARERARQLVAVGDLTVREGREGPVAARAALAEYRAAGRFDQEDANIQIRQAILLQALGQSRDADRAIARATGIDGRLGHPFETVPPDAGGFLAPPPAGTPLVAVRGRAILDEIAAAAAAEAAAEPQGRPPVVAWLEQVWIGRWGGSLADPAEPARGPAP